MQKLLIYWALGASLAISGCSTVEKLGNAVPDALDKLPLIYRPDIQQGNMVEQEMVDRLQPGMSKTQVRYIMGTPMLVDAFHQERWDYVYRMKKRGEAPEQVRITLYFEDDHLTSIKGDLYPQPENALNEEIEEPVVSVPDYEERNKGFVTRMMEKVGLDSEQDETDL